MGKLKNNETGFSAIEAVLIIIIVILIGVVGWLVYKNHKNSTNSTAKTSALATSAKNTTATSSNPYAGWKSFCSSAGGLCLKYPSTWILSQQTDPYETDTITSPSGNVAVQYLPTGGAGAGTGGTATVNVVNAIKASSSNFEVVSLVQNQTDVTAPNYAAYLFAVPTAEAVNANSQTYANGLTYTNSYEPTIYSFTDSSLNQYAQVLDVYQPNSNPPSNLFNGEAEAQTWLKSSEVKTAAQILASVSLK